MRVNNEQVLFNIYTTMEYSQSTNDYFEVSIIKETVVEVQQKTNF